MSEEKGTTKFLVPSLFISQLTTRPAGILTGFILIDIAQTFGTSVGVAGQIITAASIAGMIVSPFLAALSIKYKPRTLLLAGITLITLSALGCSFSFSYASMLLLYSLNGLGAAMVTPMVMTIIGDKIPEERRSGVIGLIYASTPMFSTLMGLTITQIVSRGWKTAYLLVVFPITTIGLILAFIGLPKAPSAESTQQASSNVREGFRQLLGHRSALACIVGTALTMIAWGGAVGRVLAVGPGHAKIRLLTDANSGVAGIVQRSRVPGIVEGYGATTLNLLYVPRFSDVVHGDRVVTSGQDGIFPRGFGIGRVGSIDESPDGTQTIQLEPELDFATLEEVLILLEPRDVEFEIASGDAAGEAP